MDPALDLSSVPVVEDAHDARLDIHARTSRAHDAQCAHVYVVPQDVVLAEPELLGPQLPEPCQQRIAPPDVPAMEWEPGTCHTTSAMSSASSASFSGAERVSRSSIRRGVRVLVGHRRATLLQ